jgi:hypothetical protein
LREALGACYLKIRKSNSLQRSTPPVHATAQGQAFPCLRTPQAAEEATEIADWSAGIGWDVTYQQVTRGEFSGSFSKTDDLAT